MYHILMNNLSAEGHLGCFYLLVILNQAARNIPEQKSVEDEEYFGHVPGTGIVESHGRFTFRDFFFFLRMLNTGEQSGYTNVLSHKGWMSFFFFTTSWASVVCCFIYHILQTAKVRKQLNSATHLQQLWATALTSMPR